MKRVAAEVAEAEPRIDVLVNNAGALFGTRQTTADNLEQTFATNHMAYFVLTLGLRERLLAAAPARVVSTASECASRAYTLDFTDLQTTNGYSAMGAYGRSKLCNILFTRELARRWSGTGVTANCLHPGFVAIGGFGDASGGLLSSVVRAAKIFAISPEKGAETIVYLASSSDAASRSGEYFYKCRPATPTAGGRDDAAAEAVVDRVGETRGDRRLIDGDSKRRGCMMYKRVFCAMGAMMAIAMAVEGVAFAQEAPMPALRPDQVEFRALYKEFVETNTTLSAGSCTVLAQHIAAHLKSAGFAEKDVTMFSTAEHPK